MEIEGSVALVTGANRGIGHAFTRALINHGAAKVYAGVRDPATVNEPDLTPLRLDVTRPEEVAAAAATAGDVTIVINNAGIASTGTNLLNGAFDGARHAMEVNYLGTWAVSRAFAPILGCSVAEQTMRALADDRVDVLADDETRKAKAALSQPPTPVSDASSGR